jgi:pilus assembly protein CpaF
MSFREAINAGGTRAWRRHRTGGATGRTATIGTSALKVRIHDKLLERFDIAAIESTPSDQLRRQLKATIEELLAEEPYAFNESERKQIVVDIQNEVTGLGPIEPLLADPSVSDILVNGCSQVFVERRGRLEKTDVVFNDDAHLLKIIERIVSRVGRRIDEASPMVDARLPDGSRVNAVIPPLALDGPSLSIRRFSAAPLMMRDLIDSLTLDDAMAQIIEGLVRARVNILISGGTGTGKTTLLNVLSGAIPESERIVTIEDAAELRLQQPHVVRLETRAANIEGNGEVTQRALLRNCLRMRPDRIVVGEVRGAEVLDMLQAMNTGHEGSMTTIHANSPRDALIRLENMVGMSGVSIPSQAFRQQIVAAISVVIQVARFADGRRKVVSVQEITGLDGEVISMQEIFGFDQSGVALNGAIQGHFRATGIRPAFCERLRVRGIVLPDALFGLARA